jgi:N-methylhydantoinase A/oxoprolinase/acetone carboxylase beta subunit
MGEYERESTCVINASVGPIVSRYLTDLEAKLRSAGFTNQLLIVQANQLVQSVSAIANKPDHSAPLRETQGQQERHFSYHIKSKYPLKKIS